MKNVPNKEISQLNDNVVALYRIFVRLQKTGLSETEINYLKKELPVLVELAKTVKSTSIKKLIDKIHKIIDPHLIDPFPPLEEYDLKRIHFAVKQLQVFLLQEKSTNLGLFEEKNKHFILLVGLKDKKLTQEIIQQIKYFNYTCIPCESLEAIYQQADVVSCINGILLDTAYCTKAHIHDLKNLAYMIPLIFVSKKTDVLTRLMAIQAGGSAFLPLPLEFTKLIEKMDQAVIPASEQIPFRILLIGSPPVNQEIENRLTHAEMILKTLTKVEKINEVLLTFQADAILLPLSIGNYSGIEIAKMIRQQDAFVSIPIIFIIQETEIEPIAHTSIQHYGDDFLIAPLNASHLINTIHMRVERYRTLHAEMIQDGLTGLLNHTRILEQLEFEIARALREKRTMSFAMIDLDHFKTVNDTHGHLVGDGVIKGLARILKQRLRKTDSIGRYGGEEFAIIFPQANAGVVFKILDEIRRGFSKLLHRSSDPKIEFTATFSGGIAELSPHCNTTDKLVQTADHALYSAKEQGRNQICILHPKHDTPPA